MRLLAFITISLCSGFCFSQEFAKTGAQWYYLDLHTPNSFDSTLQDFYYLESVKDTFILGKNCKKVMHKHVSLYHGKETPKEAFYFLSENNKVYFYKFDKFNLLYDFSAQIGDTIKTYDYNPSSLNIDSMSKQVLDSFVYDSINFTNQIRKIYFTTLLNEIEYDFPEGYHGPVIENIGGEYWIITFNDFFHDEDEKILFCYYEEGDAYIRKPSYCDRWKAYIDAQKSSILTISLFPNPISNEAKLTFPNPSLLNHKLKIYNLIGQQIQEQETTSSEFLLSESDFSSGLYFYELYQENAFLAGSKFMVE